MPVRIAPAWRAMSIVASMLALAPSSCSLCCVICCKVAPPICSESIHKLKNKKISFDGLQPQPRHTPQNQKEALTPEIPATNFPNSKSNFPCRSLGFLRGLGRRVLLGFHHSKRVWLPWLEDQCLVPPSEMLPELSWDCLLLPPNPASPWHIALLHPTAVHILEESNETEFRLRSCGSWTNTHYIPIAEQNKNHAMSSAFFVRSLDKNEKQKKPRHTHSDTQSSISSEGIKTHSFVVFVRFRHLCIRVVQQRRVEGPLSLFRVPCAVDLCWLTRVLFTVMIARTST